MSSDDLCGAARDRVEAAERALINLAALGPFANPDNLPLLPPHRRAQLRRLQLLHQHRQGERRAASRRPLAELHRLNNRGGR